MYSYCIIIKLYVTNIRSMSINYRRKFRSQTSDNMARWKRRGGKSQRGAKDRKSRGGQWEESERRRAEERRSEKRKSEKKKHAGARTGRKVAKHSVFPMICGSGGRKVGSLKRRVRSMWPDERWTIARRRGAKRISKSKCTKHTILGPLLDVEMLKKCTPLWREAHFQVKMYKTHHSRTTFGSWDVEKVHAVVVRSTFRSQNVQSTSASEHFWKLRCRKSARRCGAKHISKSKVLNADGLGPLLDVQMWFRVAGARDSAPCQKWAKPLHYTTLQLHYTDTTLHWLHYTTLRYPTLHSTTLTTTTLHYTTLITLHYVHYTNYIALHYTALHSATIHYTWLHYIQFHYTTLITTTTTTTLH